MLEGDNKYEADVYGKQEAKKGMRFSILPPVLMLYLKRFEYDYEKDKNIKVPIQKVTLRTNVDYRPIRVL